MNRIIEIVLSIITLLLLIVPFIVFSIVALFFFEPLSLFSQTRIGLNGKHFTIYKLQTMQDGKVLKLGKFLRKTKIDELPQLINILKGDMSFVGPRPDIAGYYDTLQGDDRKVLLLKPGLTSLAAIKYRNEERLLAQQEEPLKYNDEIIFPDKIKMNLEYLGKRSLSYDLKIIFLTVKSLFN